MRIQRCIQRLGADQGIIRIAAHPISLRTVERVCRGVELIGDFGVSAHGFAPCVEQDLGGSAVLGGSDRRFGAAGSFARSCSAASTGRSCRQGAEHPKTRKIPHTVVVVRAGEAFQLDPRAANQNSRYRKDFTVSGRFVFSCTRRR
jgi:hypothetical protein